MPEGPEVETEKLREEIDEELERDGGSFLRRIALTTAILAALAAIASLRAGATVNEALFLKTEAARRKAASATKSSPSRSISSTDTTASPTPWRSLRSRSRWARWAAMTRNRPVWILSLSLGAGGLALFVVTLLR